MACPEMKEYVPVSNDVSDFRKNRERKISFFINAKLFAFIFGVIGVVQGAYFSYFVAILTTLEKRYAFGTKTSGIILISDNLGPILFGVIAGFYAKHAHRPKFIFIGMMFAVIGCILSSCSFFIYGTDSRIILEEKISANSSNPYLCLVNSTETVSKDCDIDELVMTYMAVCVLFIGNFFNGIGSVAYYTIGTSYLDDNVRKDQSPLYLGCIFAVRMIGPTLGFLLAGVCLKLYENPFVDPGFSNKDPRWIGAWWIGFIVLGMSLFVSSIPIILFPKSIVQSPCEQPKFSCHVKLIFQNMCSSLKNIVKSKILVCHALSITFQINGIFAYFTYMPKYMESQYGQTASLSSFFSGATALITMIAGVLLGGAIIHLVKPKARCLTGYMVFVELFAILALASAIFLGCPDLPRHKYSTVESASSQSCSAHCKCDTNTYEPVCVNGKEEYFSACFAGCEEFSTDDYKSIFHNCSCFSSSVSFENATMRRGPCEHYCDTFLAYFAILTAGKVLIGTTKVGNILITLRSVSEDEKALALGTVESLISIFATIPYPLIYGYLIDGTCLIWEENCHRQGNCLLYDNEKFKNNLHLLSVCFLACGLVCEVIVFYSSKNMKDIYGRDDHQHCLQGDVLVSLK